MKTNKYLRVCLTLFSTLGVFQMTAAEAKESSSSAPTMKAQQEKSADLSIKAKLNYLIALPEDYEAKESHPLVLFLHGVGERGDGQLDRVKINGPPKLIARGKRYPCIVVSPQCPSNRWWDAAELSALLDHLEATYKVDAKRIYVTGLSMGGYGTWDLAMRQPNRFAAIAPVCGGGNTRTVKYLDKITAAIWAFHGEDDTVVSVEELYAMQAEQKKRGVEMKVTIYPGVGHNSWVDAYESNDELFDWLLSHSRE